MGSDCLQLELKGDNWLCSWQELMGGDWLHLQQELMGGNMRQLLVMGSDRQWVELMASNWLRLEQMDGSRWKLWLMGRTGCGWI